MAATLVGCVSGGYSSNDVNGYVNDMKIGKCKISSPTKNEYDENVWTVTQASTGIEFEVLDDVSAGGMLPGKQTHTLRNNFPQKMVEYYQDKIEGYKGFHVYEGSIVVEYSDLDELNAACKDVVDLYNFLFEQYGEFSCQANLLYKGEFTDNMKFSASVDGSRCMAERTRILTTIPAKDVKGGFEKIYGTAKDNYLMIGLAHGVDSIVNEFSNDEVEESMCSDTYGLDRIVTYPADGGKGKASTKAVRMMYFYYGSLYQYLCEQGIDVSGTFSDFTVVGADGKTYEFSYDFYNEKDDKTYYMADDVKVYNQNRFCLDEHELETLFGVSVDFMDNSTVEKKQDAGEIE